jgi:hypothetical protein
MYPIYNRVGNENLQEINNDDDDNNNNHNNNNGVKVVNFST